MLKVNQNNNNDNKSEGNSPVRCHICNKTLTEPTFNRDHGDIDPCHECSEIIQDTLAGYKDKAVIDEDDLGGEESFGDYPVVDCEPEFL